MIDKTLSVHPVAADDRQSHEGVMPLPAAAEFAGPPTLRLWLPLAVLVVFWTCILSVTYAELAMFPRFVSRFSAHLALLVFFLVWWLSRRRYAWRDRLLAAGLVIASSVAAALAGHTSTNLFMMLFTGLPYVFSLGVAWLLVSRNRSLNVQRVGFAVVNLLIFGCLSLLRWDGLDGRQRAQFNWRWSPSAEERFLSSARHDLRDPDSPPTARPWSLQPGDWGAFRGGERESVVTDVSLADWETQPPQLVWRRRVGPAWSSMIVVDGFLVTQEQRGEAEAVVCYDAQSGQEVWVHEDQDRFYEGLAGAGPRGTPTFNNGRIYTLGAKGRLNCLSAATGEALWSKDIIAETAAAVPQWGLSVSPQVVDDLVIIFAGGSEGRSLIAYRAESGQLAWSSAGGSASYSSPQLFTIGGVPQIIMHDNRGLHSVNVHDGGLLWEHPSTNEMFQPMLQPHLVGQTGLLVGWDNGIALLDVQPRAGQWSVSQQWTSNRLKPTFNDFVIHQGHIYGLDDGILCCLELETARRSWKGGRYGFGQLLLLPDQNELLVLSERGEAVRVATDPSKHRELYRFPLIEGKTWNHPVMAHGRLYARNSEEMACYRLMATGSNP